MSYKNALAGLDLGGGKAVIIGDPNEIKSEALLRAYGRFVQSLNGRYYTACDVGTYVQDMDVVARESEFVTGRSVESGGAGDSSVLTAYGVFQGMRASAEYLWGSPSLAGKRVGISGVGKVGRYLVGHLIEDGASIVATDPHEGAIQWLRDNYAQVELVSTTEELIAADIDVYAPCALGGALDDATVAALTAKIVCGAANNQLAHTGVEKQLEARGILYAPDYLVNSGGVIQVADEIHGLRLRAGQAPRLGHLRHHDADLLPGVGGGRAAVGGRRPARRAADARRRPPARRIPAVSCPERTPRQIPPVARGIDAGISAIVGSCL